MFKINKWKLALIIGVFVLFGLYLLPVPNSLYSSLFGYLDVWMQEEIPRPEVITGESSEENTSEDANAETTEEESGATSAASGHPLTLRHESAPAGS